MSVPELVVSTYGLLYPKIQRRLKKHCDEISLLIEGPLESFVRVLRNRCLAERQPSEPEPNLGGFFPHEAIMEALAEGMNWLILKKWILRFLQAARHKRARPTSLPDICFWEPPDWAGRIFYSYMSDIDPNDDLPILEGMLSRLWVEYQIIDRFRVMRDAMDNPSDAEAARSAASLN